MEFNVKLYQQVSDSNYADSVLTSVCIMIAIACRNLVDCYWLWTLRTSFW